MEQEHPALVPADESEDPEAVPPAGPQEIPIRAEQIGKLLSDKRNYHDLSLRVCAERIKTSRQRYAAIEAGESKIRFAELEELMRFFSIKPEEIWPKWGKGLPSQELITTLQVSAGQRMTIVVEGLDRSG
jgi:Helix-turn-helix